MVVIDVHETATKGFSSQVDAYELGRPSYPVEAVAAALQTLGIADASGRRNSKVLDLASGTGKFTRLLAAQAHLDVQAVEPNAGMRKGFERLQSTWGLDKRIPLHDGSATSLPFEEHTFDAVFVAQGFHWFANEASLREIYRVLKPGGGLALIWNREDDAIPWQAELLQVFEPLSTGIPQYWQGTWRQAFNNSFAKDALGVHDPLRHSQFFRWTNTMTRPILWARLLSRSYIAALDKPAQDKVKEALSELLQRHPNIFHPQPPDSTSKTDIDSPQPDAEGSEVVDVVLKTELFICRRQ